MLSICILASASSLEILTSNVPLSLLSDPWSHNHNYEKTDQGTGQMTSSTRHKDTVRTIDSPTLKRKQTNSGHNQSTEAAPVAAPLWANNFRKSLPGMHCRWWKYSEMPSSYCPQRKNPPTTWRQGTEHNPSCDELEMPACDKRNKKEWRLELVNDLRFLSSLVTQSFTVPLALYGHSTPIHWQADSTVHKLQSHEDTPSHWSQVTHHCFLCQKEGDQTIYPQDGNQLRGVLKDKVQYHTSQQAWWFRSGWWTLCSVWLPIFHLVWWS